MTKELRYITDEQGTQIGVLLDLEEYKLLTGQEIPDQDLLIGISEAELRALADSKLAPTAQARLDDLLTRHHEEPGLTSDEVVELDQLLDQIDQLNILKTRARYTLNHKQTFVTAP